MSLEHFLDIFFRSNVLLIEVLFGMVLCGIIFLTVRSFTRPEEMGSGANLQGLEEGIKKILENYSPGATSTAVNHSPSTETEGSGSAMEEMVTQIERLKIQLMQKSEEVEQLKAGGGSVAVDPAQFQEVGAATAATPASTTTSSDSGNAAALEEKIKDLEARLSEYSIIEDDIADLSFYKEETVRLQAEIDQLKEKLAKYESGAVAPTASMPQSKVASVAAVPESTPEPAKTSDSVAPAAQPAEAAGVDDDIMAEFERAVAEQKAISASQKMAKEVPPPPAEVETAAAEPSDNAAEIVEGGIDLDKMMNEVGALPQEVSEDATNALEQALDTEKLLQEATGMEKLDSEAMNEFDQFLKKEGA